MAKKNPVAVLEGADALNVALRSVGDHATGLIVKRAAEAGADVIAKEARVRAPRDTGALAESIHAEPGRIQQGRALFNIGFGKRQWYGSLLEFGTKHMPAQPFLRPAFDAKSEEATEAVRKVLVDALKGVLS